VFARFRRHHPTHGAAVLDNPESIPCKCLLGVLAMNLPAPMQRPGVGGAPVNHDAERVMKLATQLAS
jgi:hypothetical protein